MVWSLSGPGRCLVLLHRCPFGTLELGICDLQESTNPLVREVWNNKISRNPANMIRYSQFDAMIRRVQREDVVMITDEIYLKYFVARLRLCRLEVSPDRMRHNYIAFPTRKGFPYLDVFNRR